MFSCSIFSSFTFNSEPTFSLSDGELSVGFDIFSSMAICSDNDDCWSISVRRRSRADKIAPHSLRVSFSLPFCEDSLKEREFYI